MKTWLYINLFCTAFFAVVLLSSWDDYGWDSDGIGQGKRYTHHYDKVEVWTFTGKVTYYEVVKEKFRSWDDDFYFVGTCSAGLHFNCLISACDIPQNTCSCGS